MRVCCAICGLACRSALGLAFHWRQAHSDIPRVSPTVKPVALMRWLVRLVTPSRGIVLDPFAGSGSTGIAAYVEGFESILVELRPEAFADIERRLAHIQGLGRHTALELGEQDLKDAEKVAKASGSGLPLFGDL